MANGDPPSAADHQCGEPCDIGGVCITVTHARPKSPDEPPDVQVRPSSFMLAYGKKVPGVLIALSKGTTLEITSEWKESLYLTSILVTVYSDYFYCSDKYHGHPTLEMKAPDTIGKGPIVRAASAAQDDRELKVYCNQPGAKESLISALTWNLSALRFFITVDCCGNRKEGQKVGRVDIPVDVYPTDFYSFTLTVPAMGQISGKRDQKDSYSFKAEANIDTLDGERRSTRVSIEKKDGATPHQYKKEVARAPSSFAIRETVENANDGSTKQAFSSGILLQLEKNGKSLEVVDSIVKVANALWKFRDLIATVWDLVKSIKFGVFFDFKIGVMEGSLTGKWGWKEYLDHRAWLYYELQATFSILRLSGTLGFGVEFTIIGYGFRSTLSGTIEGDIAVKSPKAYRKSPDVPLWAHDGFKFDSKISGTLTFQAMAGESGYIECKGSVVTGFSLKGCIEITKVGLVVRGDVLKFDGAKAAGTIYWRGNPKLDLREVPFADETDIKKNFQIFP